MEIYLDTSVISALFDERNPERRGLTEEFFESIDVYTGSISGFTLVELENTTDPSLRSRMLAVANRFSVLPTTDDARMLADEYIEYGAMSENYAEDGFHIATAVVNQIPVLLSWNFRHMVRRKTRDVVNMVNSMRGFSHIEIITPGELL